VAAAAAVRQGSRLGTKPKVASVYTWTQVVLMDHVVPETQQPTDSNLTSFRVGIKAAAAVAAVMVMVVVVLMWMEGCTSPLSARRPEWSSNVTAGFPTWFHNNFNPHNHNVSRAYPISLVHVTPFSGCSGPLRRGAGLIGTPSRPWGSPSCLCRLGHLGFTFTCHDAALAEH